MGRGGPPVTSLASRRGRPIGGGEVDRALDRCGHDTWDVGGKEGGKDIERVMRSGTALVISVEIVGVPGGGVPSSVMALVGVEASDGGGWAWPLMSDDDDDDLT